jgi:hypothetical protein
MSAPIRTVDRPGCFRAHYERTTVKPDVCKTTSIKKEWSSSRGQGRCNLFDGSYKITSAGRQEDQPVATSDIRVFAETQIRASGRNIFNQDWQD